MSSDAAIMLEQRLLAVYRALAQQGSVPPALRLRTEGFAESLLALGLLDAVTLATMLETVHCDCLGCAFSSRQGRAAADCIDASEHRLRLPARMERAPVWPSTSE